MCRTQQLVGLQATVIALVISPKPLSLPPLEHPELVPQRVVFNARQSCGQPDPDGTLWIDSQPIGPDMLALGAPASSRLVGADGNQGRIQKV